MCVTIITTLVTTVIAFRLADVLDEFSFHQICCAMLLWQRTIISLGSLVRLVTNFAFRQYVLTFVCLGGADFTHSGELSGATRTFRRNVGATTSDIDGG